MHAGVRISSADHVRVGDLPPRLILDLYRQPSTPYSFMLRGGRSAMTVRVGTPCPPVTHAVCWRCAWARFIGLMPPASIPPGLKCPPYFAGMTSGLPFSAI